MKLTPKEQAIDIEKTLDRIEEIIVKRELPQGLVGDLMSQSLDEFHRKLAERFAKLQSQLK